MKYVITIIALLAVLFGIQWYINGQSSTVTTSDTINNQQIQNTMDTSSSSDKLVIKDTVVGTGKEAKSGSKVTVNYTGMFTDGKVFDSSIPRREPFTFMLGAGQVIKGWDQGVVGMKEGGKRHLVIPPTLGYGMNTYGPIPGGSTLIFDVELLKVE